MPSDAILLCVISDLFRQITIRPTTVGTAVVFTMNGCVIQKQFVIIKQNYFHLCALTCVFENVDVDILNCLLEGGTGVFKTMEHLCIF